MLLTLFCSHLGGHCLFDLSIQFEQLKLVCTKFLRSPFICLSFILIFRAMSQDFYRHHLFNVWKRPKRNVKIRFVSKSWEKYRRKPKILITYRESVLRGYVEGKRFIVMSEWKQKRWDRVRTLSRSRYFFLAIKEIYANRVTKCPWFSLATTKIHSATIWWCVTVRACVREQTESISSINILKCDGMANTLRRDWDGVAQTELLESAGGRKSGACAICMSEYLFQW